MPSESRAVVEIRPNAIPSAPSTSCAKKPIPIRAKNSGVKKGLSEGRRKRVGSSLALLANQRCPGTESAPDELIGQREGPNKFSQEERLPGPGRAPRCFL